jgi:hypothetical protein
MITGNSSIDSVASGQHGKKVSVLTVLILTWYSAEFFFTWNIICPLMSIWFSLLYDGYRAFPRGKERPGHDADPSPPSSAVVKEREELYLYSPYRPYGLYRASVPVQGCTLLFYYVYMVGDKQVNWKSNNAKSFTNSNWHQDPTSCNIHKSMDEFHQLKILTKLILECNPKLDENKLGAWKGLTPTSKKYTMS